MNFSLIRSNNNSVCDLKVQVNNKMFLITCVNRRKWQANLILFDKLAETFTVLSFIQPDTLIFRLC